MIKAAPWRIWNDGRASCSGLSHVFDFEPLSRARTLVEAIIRQIHIILKLWQYLLNGLSQIKSAFVWWKYINQLWFIRLDYDVNSCCEHKAGYRLGVLLDINSKKEAQLSFLQFWLNQYKQCIIIPACATNSVNIFFSFISKCSTQRFWLQALPLRMGTVPLRSRITYSFHSYFTKNELRDPATRGRAKATRLNLCVVFGAAQPHLFRFLPLHKMVDHL